MKTEQTLTYFLICILICSGFVSLVEAQKKTKPGKQKTIVSVKSVEISEVESVSFDKETIFLVCPYYDLSKEDEKLKVSIIAKNTEKEELSYYYFVSGGKIVGEGSNVIWDFFGVLPGEYSITIGVGKDFIINGKTITKKIIVQEASICDPPCDCPSLSITRSAKMPVRGDSLIFTAKIGEIKNIQLKWTISNGTIIAGQGSAQILVKPSNKASVESMTVTLEIQGYDLCRDCQMEKTIVVYFRKEPISLSFQSSPAHR
jgi:hypothetical protein